MCTLSLKTVFALAASLLSTGKNASR